MYRPLIETPFSTSVGTTTWYISVVLWVSVSLFQGHILVDICSHDNPPSSFSLLRLLLYLLRPPASPSRFPPLFSGIIVSLDLKSCVEFPSHCLRTDIKPLGGTTTAFPRKRRPVDACMPRPRVRFPLRGVLSPGPLVVVTLAPGTHKGTAFPRSRVRRERLAIIQFFAQASAFAGKVFFWWHFGRKCCLIAES